MKRTAKDSKGEIGRVRIVEDFLPSPGRLVLREQNVKVTLSLSQRSVAFFKRVARRRRVPYQRMIRALVDAYAEKQEGRDDEVSEATSGTDVTRPGFGHLLLANMNKSK
ncbi:MAG: hypothetical protein QOD89_2557 [Bradyrhizobium sp.]|jgi:hypothetical protein|nr:hypothetical protein [Bradyrhizobium sp.]